MGACYSVYLKCKIKDEAQFVRLSSDKLHGGFGGGLGIDIREDCFKDYDLKTALNNIKFVLAAHQHDFHEHEEDGWPIYSSGFNASYGWNMILDEWFCAVAPALEDGSILTVYPDSGSWTYVVRNGEAVEGDEGVGARSPKAGCASLLMTTN